MTALAKRVREEIIVPVCKKHKLHFFSGNGDFYFWSGAPSAPFHEQRQTHVYGVEDETFKKLSKTAQAKLQPIFDLLNKEVSHAQHLGYWIENVE